MTTEKNAYNDDCFKSSYRLSSKKMEEQYHTKKFRELFHGRTLVSWAIASAPRHPIIFRTMENIVDLIRLEYLRSSAIVIKMHDVKWKLCMCSTGPSVLTASAREALLHNGLISNQNQSNIHSKSKSIDYIIYKRDFHQFGGVFKMPQPKTDTSEHYMRTMHKYNLPLLKSYFVPTTIADLENKLVKQKEENDIFYVCNGSRRGFEDFDTFVKMEFLLKDVVDISKDLLDSIPLLEPKYQPSDAENNHKKGNMNHFN